MADTIVPEVVALITAFDNDAAALSAYASEVEQIKDLAMGLRVQEARTADALGVWERKMDQVSSSWRAFTPVDGTQHSQSPGSTTKATEANAAASQSEMQRLQSRADESEAALRVVQARWDELSVRRRTADNSCVAALTGAASRGGLAHLTGRTLTGITAPELLRRMTGMTAAELTILFTRNPHLADILATATDPTAVAAWWNSLAGTTPVDIFGYGGTADGVPDPSAAQLALIGLIPQVIGNLGGVMFTHRDQANRSVHTAELDTLNKLEQARQTFFAAGEGYRWTELLTDRGSDVASFTDAYLEAQAIDKALVAADGITYQLVHYLPGSPTLAAISVGNMDTATRITTNVSGMGSNVTESMEGWTAAAANLWEAQGKADIRATGAESGLAVVSWLGYDAPPMTLGIPHSDVLVSDRAEAGSSKLVLFLEGITAARGWSPGENLSVVAHSYGTTTASIALTQTPVENVVFLGSAGLDPSVDKASDMQVDVSRVWASEAAGDTVANAGRGVVQLSPEVGFGTSGPHPVDPTLDNFGGRVFSSEEAVLDGRVLVASDGHSAAPRIDAELKGETSAKYGYLDVGTTPLRNTAFASMGFGDNILPYTHPQQLVIR